MARQVVPGSLDGRAIPGAHPHLRYSREDCLTALRLIADELGHTPSNTYWKRSHLRPGDGVILTHYGSWSAAITAAGLRPATTTPKAPHPPRSAASHRLPRLPDNTNWRDTGCTFAPRCQDCPLPRCKFEMPPKQPEVFMRLLQFARLAMEGCSMRDMEDKIHISSRSVFRLRQRAQRIVAVGEFV